MRINWTLLQCIGLLVFLFPGHSAQAEVAPAEKTAMVAFFYATGGLAWSVSTNWPNGDPCTDAWFGVTCNGLNTSIVELDLYNNNLAGIIPAELGDLSNITRLNLSLNQLSGSIPVRLGDLDNLLFLDLGSNQLEGSIPSELGGLPVLQFLSLSNNNLTGAIPQELGSLSELRQLLLENNRLSGAIPSQLGDLSRLQWMWLNSNKLSGAIPPELGNLAQGWLELCGNQLEGAVPVELINVDQLNLHYNALYTDNGFLDSVLDQLHWSDWSATQTVAPTNPRSIHVAGDSIVFAWNPIEYIEDSGRYQMWYRTTPNGPYLEGPVTDSKAGKTLTLTGLQPETEYHVAVQAITDARTNDPPGYCDNPSDLTSEFSSEVSAATGSQYIILGSGFEGAP